MLTTPNVFDPGTTLILDPDQQIAGVTRTSVWPPDPDRYVGISLRDMFVKEWGAEAAGEALTALHEHAVFEHAFDDESGSPRAVLLRLLHGATPADRVLVCVDTTAHRHELAESELNARRLRSILEGTRVGSWEWNVQTGETRFNERWAEIVGYTLDELEPITIETWMRFAYEPDLKASNEALEAHFRGDADFYDIECRMQHREGHLVWVHDRGRVFTWTKDGRPLLMFGTHQEITERKRREEERLRLAKEDQDRERLTSLGLMAGGIAHDFNNILQAIIGFTGLLAEDLPPEMTEGHESVAEISRAAARASALTGQMLDYSGGGSLSTAPVSVEELTAEVVRMVQAGLPPEMRIEFTAAPDVPWVECHESQLHQVVLNLLSNAVEALPDGRGRVEVETRVREVGTALLWNERVASRNNHDLQPGRFYEIRVTDDGSGIDDETLRLIFDPFFSTKFTGRGLGMASVFGILSAHRSGLVVETRVGEGTTMRVLLPEWLFRDAQPQTAEFESASSAPSRFRVSSPQRIRPVALHGRRAMVVDDEPGVLTVLARNLERWGWSVETFESGYPALEAFSDTPEKWGLVLLDLVMPGLGGVELFRRIRGVRADVPVVMISGYHSESIQAGFSTDAPDAILEKPFGADTLHELLVRLFGSTVDSAG